MSKRQIRKTTGDLASLLEQLIELQKALHEVIRGKLDAMRRCDAQAMTAAAHREGNVSAKIAALDDCRRERVGELCRALDIPRPGRIANVTLRTLARHLDKKQGEHLNRLGETLRERMLKVAEANRVVELVTQEMLQHFRNLFSVFTQDEEGSQMYSRGGAVASGAGAKVLDAVG